MVVNLLAPGDRWGDRVNELDLRVAKVFRLGRTRTNVGVDVYNVFNSSAVLSYNQTFIPGDSWLTPLMVLTPRFAKSARRSISSFKEQPCPGSMRRSSLRHFACWHSAERHSPHRRPRRRA